MTLTSSKYVKPISQARRRRRVASRLYIATSMRGGIAAWRGRSSNNLSLGETSERRKSCENRHSAGHAEAQGSAGAYHARQRSVGGAHSMPFTR